MVVDADMHLLVLMAIEENSFISLRYLAENLHVVVQAYNIPKMLISEQKK